MLRSIFSKFLRDEGRGIIAWSVAIAAVGAIYAAFYPSVSGPDMAAAMEAFPPELMAALGMTDITSAAGYVGSTTYGILGPILAIIFGGSLGARAIAGAEESGFLEVLMAHPVERWSVVVQRAAAIFVALVVAGATLFVVMVGISIPAELDSIGTQNFAAATAQLVLLALVFATLALAIGALTGSRGLALGVMSAVAVLTYFANTLGPTTENLAWTQQFSPFYYYSGGQPLVNGFQTTDALILGATAVVLVVIAAAGFLRRDIGV